MAVDDSWPMIQECRRYQLNSDAVPGDVMLMSVIEGYVDLKYGSLSDGYEPILIPNAGAPYLMKVLGENAVHYTSLPEWEWGTTD